VMRNIPSGINADLRCRHVLRLLSHANVRKRIRLVNAQEGGGAGRAARALGGGKKGVFREL